MELFYNERLAYILSTSMVTKWIFKLKVVENQVKCLRWYRSRQHIIASDLSTLALLGLTGLHDIIVQSIYLGNDRLFMCC